MANALKDRLVDRVFKERTLTGFTADHRATPCWTMSYPLYAHPTKTTQENVETGDRLPKIRDGDRCSQGRLSKRPHENINKCGAKSRKNLTSTAAVEGGVMFKCTTVPDSPSAEVFQPLKLNSWIVSDGRFRSSIIHNVLDFA